MEKLLYSKNRLLIVLFLAIALSLVVFFSGYNYLVALLILGLVLALFLFFLKPALGLYLITLFLPVTGFAFYFKFLEVPLIDSISLIVLTAFIIQQIYLFCYSEKKEKIKFPLGGAFLLFFIITLISGLISDNIFSSLWYSFRWILFFYLAFMVLHYNIVKDLKILKRALMLLALGGILVAIMGLSSLFLQDWSDPFFRVKPLFLLGDWIFGENYNLLSEFLIVSVFVILSLKYWIKNIRTTKLINVMAVFLILINFLTFGRTAWITIALQLILYFIIDNFIIKKRKIFVKEILLATFFALILVAPFFVRMISLQEVNISSTQNRILLTQISWEAFLEKPFFGYGSGSFVSLVGDNIRFIAKYGDPLDSHGFGQKVLAENGILGLLSFLLFLFLIFRKIFLGLTNNQEEYKLLLPLLIASFGAYFYQIFNTSYYKGRVWLPIALTLVAINIISEKKKKLKEK